MTASAISPPTPQVFVDGRTDASVDATDRGLAYGDGLFETCRVMTGAIPLWDRHLQRLVRDLERLSIPFSINELKEKVNVALCATTGRSGTLKLMVTRGSGGRGYGPPDAAACRVITLFYADTDDPFAELAAPARLWLCRTRLGDNPALAGMKHLARLENVLARAEFQVPPYDEGLVLNGGDEVIEATAHNVFARVDDTLITPPLTASGVAGVMRQLVLEELAPACGWHTREAPLSLAKLVAADEVLLCNSNRGVRAVGSLDDGERELGHWPQTACALALQTQLNNVIQEVMSGKC